MYYIRFEEYDASTGMNGNERTSLDEHLWIDVDGQNGLDGPNWKDRIERTKVNKQNRMKPNGPN
jgi:hypothetical protein